MKKITDIEKTHQIDQEVIQKYIHETEKKALVAQLNND